VTDSFGGSNIARLTLNLYPTNNYGTLQGNRTTSFFNPGYINRIQLADLDKTSGNNNGYADFRSLIATLTPGQTVNYTFTPGGNSSTVRWTVWIDFNRDGDFGDSGETIVGPTAGSSSAVSGSFTVPAGASVGPSRMRIAMRLSSTGQTSPTGSFSNGEVEDYSVQIGTNPTPNAAPYFLSDPITKSDMAADSAMSGLLTGDAGDWEGDPLTYAKTSGPAWLTVASNGTLSGTPPASARGVNSFTVSVTDGSGGTDTATLQLNVLNNAPVATAQSLSSPWQNPVAVTLSGTDADGDALTFAVDSQPANGSLSGTAPALTYTPGALFSGTDSFTFHVSDGSVNSTTATITLVVAPAPYDAWKQAKFTAQQLAQPGVVGDLDDPDRDGIANLIEYALGLNPNQASGSGLPVGGIHGGYLTLTFNRQKSATDIAYQVEAVGNLNSSWVEIWNSSNEPYGGGSNPSQQVTVQDTVPVSNAPKRIMRLKVTK
jgi:hypothetical protein